MPVDSRDALSGWDILGLKSCVSLKPLPPAGLMDEWVPADGGGGGKDMHLYDHTAARHSGCCEVHTQLSDRQDDHQISKVSISS